MKIAKGKRLLAVAAIKKSTTLISASWLACLNLANAARGHGGGAAVPGGVAVGLLGRGEGEERVEVRAATAVARARRRHVELDLEPISRAVAEIDAHRVSCGEADLYTIAHSPCEGVLRSARAARSLGEAAAPQALSGTDRYFTPSGCTTGKGWSRLARLAG